nr:hypothetical protein BaRGS_034680 [Batillaria attramentaria]
MQPDDPLHFVNLSIACATAAFSCAGMFVQQWFTGHRQRTAIDATRFLYKVPADEIEGKESATAQAEAAHRLIAEAPPEDDPEASSAV